MLPRVCDDVSPLDGRIRERFEDFRVDEVPAFEPAGEGDHCLVHIEKTDLTTREAIKRLARALGVQPRDVGSAGMKDRRAVTTQWLSLPDVDPERARDASADGLRVLAAERHPKKLRTGQLRGNRFAIRVRGAPSARVPDAAAVMTRLVERGLPNYFGPQRFGRDGKNVEHARAWLVDGGKAPRDRFQRKLLVSSLQSALFNDTVDARVREGRLGTVEEGDLLRKEETGGLFTSDDPAVDQPRADSWELSPTGPIFGPKMRWPTGAAERRERAQLEAAGIDDAILGRIGKAGPGTRRVVRLRPGDAGIEACEDGFLARFTLPAGSYATVLLREILHEEECL